jgi:hypothetical protein
MNNHSWKNELPPTGGGRGRGHSRGYNRGYQSLDVSTAITDWVKTKKTMISGIGYSVLTGAAFALFGLFIGYVLNSPIPFALGGFIIGLLLGCYSNPEIGEVLKDD